MAASTEPCCCMTCWLCSAACMDGSNENVGFVDGVVVDVLMAVTALMNHGGVPVCFTV